MLHPADTASSAALSEHRKHKHHRGSHRKCSKKKPSKTPSHGSTVADAELYPNAPDLPQRSLSAMGTGRVAGALTPAALPARPSTVMTSPPLEHKTGASVDSRNSAFLFHRDMVGRSLPRFFNVYNPAHDDNKQTTNHNLFINSGPKPRSAHDTIYNRRKDWIANYMEHYFLQSKSGTLLRGSGYET